MIEYEYCVGKFVFLGSTVASYESLICVCVCCDVVVGLRGLGGCVVGWLGGWVV